MRGISFIWILLLALVAIIIALVYIPYVTVPPTAPTPTPTPTPTPQPTTGGIGAAPSVPTGPIQCINVYLNKWKGTKLYFSNISIRTVRAGVGQANATVIFYDTLPRYFFNSSVMYQFRPDPLNYPENFSQFLFENATRVVKLDQWGSNLSIEVVIPTWLTENDTFDNVAQRLSSYANDVMLGILYEPYRFKYFIVLTPPGYYGFSDEFAYTVAINPNVANYTANSTDECLQLVDNDPNNVFLVLMVMISFLLRTIMLSVYSLV